MTRNKLVGLALIACVCTMLLVSIQPVKANPQFALASWDYPDEYGQGILMIAVYENSTGAWELVDTRYSNESQVYSDWEIGVAIKLRCWTFFNSTFTGANDLDDGKNYQQHNVVVNQFNGTTVFSQQNFTFFDSNDYDDMWQYEYEVVLDFLPVQGQVYTVTIIYEIWW